MSFEKEGSFEMIEATRQDITGELVLIGDRKR